MKNCHAPHYYKQNMFYPQATCPYTYHEGSVDIDPRILNLGTRSSLNYIILYCHNIEVWHSANYKSMYEIHYSSV